MPAFVISQALPITVDPDTAAHAWTTTLDLAEQHRFTIYDASYLELAIRLSLPLATRDRRLQDAAARSGLPSLA